MSQLSIPNVTAQVPNTFSVDIDFDPQGSSVSALGFDIPIPSNATFNNSVVAGPAATAANKQVAFSVVNNAVRVLVFGINQTAMPAGVLATVGFTAKAAGTSPLNFLNASASDPNGGAVSLQTTAGTLTIGGLMPTSQQQFDSTLTPFLAQIDTYINDVTALITAVTALIAKVKGLEGQTAVDLTTELNAVSASLAKVQPADTAVTAETPQVTGA